MADRLRKLEQDSFDAIVVGAGTGGLTTAGLLAQKGLKVLVLDRHYVAGGNATVFRRRDYEFDVGLHYIGDCGPNGLIPRVLRACGVTDVEFEELDPDGYETYVFPDLTFRVPKGLERFRTRLKEVFPKESAGIDRYCKLLSQIQEFQKVIASPLSGLWVLPKSTLLLRWANKTFGEFMASCTDDARLKAVLGGQHGDYGMPPSRASLIIGAAVANHYLQGAFFPKGGGQIMADKLADAIEAKGGKILLRATVEQILVEDGVATGVRFTNKHTGERVVRAPIVVSNADLKHTIADLIGAEHLRERTIEKTAAYEMSPALACLYLGINRDLKAEGHPRTNYWIYPEYDYEPAYADIKAQRFVEHPFAYISIASLKDPTNTKLAPEGVTNLQVMSLVPSSFEAWGITEAEYQDGSYRKKEAYLEKKAALMAQLIEAAKPVFPDLAEQIVFSELATPITHRRYVNSAGGTSYGIALTPEQFLNKRPGPKTEISGLYLCGASTRAGHGIGGVTMSGLEAAAAILGKKLIRDVLGKTNQVSGDAAEGTEAVGGELTGATT